MAVEVNKQLRRHHALVIVLLVMGVALLPGTVIYLNKGLKPSSVHGLTAFSLESNKTETAGASLNSGSDKAGTMANIIFELQYGAAPYRKL